MIKPQAQAVLDFWFGAPNTPAHGQVRPEWFRKDAGFDTQIRQSFGQRVAEAIAGGLQDWDHTADGALARIIVLDQFTRNMFRDTPQAFAGDTLALQAAQAVLARGDGPHLRPEQRVFTYLPFEHDETLASQDRSVALFTALAQDTPALAPYLDYARRHREVIQRFGRFVHRNQVLGRTSSAEELAFLQQPGSSF